MRFLLPFTVVLVPQPTFGQQAQTELLELREIGFWMETYGKLGHGPPAQWLSLLFYTPGGAWPLRQSTWVSS